MTLGKKIRALRKKKYTQEELADRLGVHVNTLIRWERGDRNPTADKLKEIADILGTTPSDLLNSDDITLESLASRGEHMPYTQEQIMNGGMLVYELGNGNRILLPPSKDSYDFLKDIALRIPQTLVTAKRKTEKNR